MSVGPSFSVALLELRSFPVLGVGVVGVRIVATVGLVWINEIGLGFFSCVANLTV